MKRNQKINDLQRHLGFSKPTYYYKNNNKILFSNDINLIRENVKKITPNIKKIKNYLAWNISNENETYFNEINRILPGTKTLININEIKTQRFNYSDHTQHKESFFTYENFKFLLDNAVVSQAPKSKNIGLMLSGGLDSSSIAVALNNCNRNVTTLSANFTC